VWIQRGDPVQLLPWLYLGSSWHASRRARLVQLDITALLNVAADDVPADTADASQDGSSVHGALRPPFACMSLPIVDNCSADIASWFPDCFRFIGNSPSSFVSYRE